jgi:hypothetical protein
MWKQIVDDLEIAGVTGVLGWIVLNKVRGMYLFRGWITCSRLCAEDESSCLHITNTLVLEFISFVWQTKSIWTKKWLISTWVGELFCGKEDIVNFVLVNSYLVLVTLNDYICLYISIIMSIFMEGLEVSCAKVILDSSRPTKCKQHLYTTTLSGARACDPSLIMYITTSGSLSNQQTYTKRSRIEP